VNEKRNVVGGSENKWGKPTQVFKDKIGEVEQTNNQETVAVWVIRRTTWHKRRGKKCVAHRTKMLRFELTLPLCGWKGRKEEAAGESKRTGKEKGWRFLSISSV